MKVVTFNSFGDGLNSIGDQFLNSSSVSRGGEDIVDKRTGKENHLKTPQKTAVESILFLKCRE